MFTFWSAVRLILVNDDGSCKKNWSTVKRGLFEVFVFCLKPRLTCVLPTGLLEKKSIQLEDTRMDYARPQIFLKNFLSFRGFWNETHS